MNTTHVAVLTPPGSGAIAVVAVQGPDAWPIARRLFRPASGRELPEQPAARATWFGRIGPGAGDEVIIAATSVEPMATIEVHCHGGQQVVRMLLDLFRVEGCDDSPLPPQSRGEGKRGRTEMFASSAWELLPYAKTFRTASILLDQANGAFDRTLGEIKQQLGEGNHAQARAAIDSLLLFAPIGRHLVEPWRIVIAGAPNAGKSSLLNALAGYQRSVVAPIPGTTRDIVTATLAFDGWPVLVSDTAGLREAGDSLEQEGVSRARQEIGEADLCLWVIDTTATPPDPEALRMPRERVVPVLNKIDQPSAWEPALFADGALVSATSGMGLDRLIQRVVETLVPNPPGPGAAIPFSDECSVVLGAQRQEIG
jgi:tRNA modification GTPase